jgi:predicted phage terminase large subunit-like protein
VRCVEARAAAIRRLSIVSPMFERGEIFLPQNAHWLMDFLDELLRFPQARFDDHVDSVTQYLNWHRNRKTKRSCELELR